MNTLIEILIMTTKQYFLFYKYKQPVCNRNMTDSYNCTNHSIINLTEKVLILSNYYFLWLKVNSNPNCEQINGDIKKELTEKLDEFATYNDSLEEIFENKEQIEVSKFYERLPKPHALAVQEWLEQKIYYRNTKDEVID